LILGLWEAQSLNGVNNNPFSPKEGAAGDRYLRIGSARYADGRSQMVTGPNVRTVSNRIFNDNHVNIFSDRGVTQWGNVWGQFVDHNIGHRDEAGTVPTSRSAPPTPSSRSPTPWASSRSTAPPPHQAPA